MTRKRSNTSFSILFDSILVSISVLINKLIACCRITAAADPMATVLNHPNLDIPSQGQTACKTDLMIEPDTPRPLNSHKLHRPEVCCAYRSRFCTCYFSIFPTVSCSQIPPPRTVLLRPAVRLRVEHFRCIH